MSQMNKESSLEGVRKMVISLCDMVMVIDTYASINFFPYLSPKNVQYHCVVSCCFLV